MSQDKGQDAGVLTPEELLIALRARTPMRPSYLYGDEGSELINPNGPQAADTIERLQARVGVLEGAVSTFLAKYDECKPHIDDAFLHRQLRCGDYTGPNFAEELTALRKASNLTKEG